MPPTRSGAGSLAAVSSATSVSATEQVGAPEASRRALSNGALAIGLAAALVAFVFVVGGGLGPAPTAAGTWTEILLIVIAAALAMVVIVFGAPGRPWGVWALALFAAVTALTAVSMAWSVAPDQSWLSANQTLSYLAAFGAAMALARLFPERWPALLGAIAIATTAVSAYALLTKVFPGTLDPDDAYGRLSVGFTYWNATGLFAAMGLPACVWAGARQRSAMIVRAASVPATAILLAVVVLSISRGAVAAAAIGLACWFALVPLRLRGLVVLAPSAVGGAAISLWALAHHPLSRDNQTLAARTGAGHTFGVVLVVVLVLMVAAGWAVALALERVRVSDRLRRRIGTALIVLVALVPVAAIGAVAASSRGLTGEISHVWHSLTNPNAIVRNTPDRLVNAGSSRARYWRDAITVGKHALAAGVGADAFGVARQRYSTDQVMNAHGYVVQTFADFGLIGLALNLALLIAWALAAWRTLAGRAPPATRQGALGEEAAGEEAANERGEAARAGERERITAERAGMLTLLATVVVFGVHSTIDWTWFFPGVAVPALACAGWLAGRGPLDQRVGLAPRRRRLRTSPGTCAAAVGIVAATLLVAWVVWLPLRSNDANNAAFEAYAHGNVTAALGDARTAAAADPVSVDPLLTEATLYGALGQLGTARRELLHAVELQPENPNSWLALGEFDLYTLHEAQTALPELRKALSLDISSAQATADIATASAG